MRKVIITGATGVIGIALIQELIEQQVEVTVVCHRESARKCRIPKSEYVRIVDCNLDELRTLIDTLDKDYDVFYHFAWACTTGMDRDNIASQINNIQYTLDAVEVAKELGCHKFIGAGSQAEYGRYHSLLNADVPTFPENGYGIAKLCAGQMSRIRCVQLGMEHIWTRVLSVYGPYDGENTMIISVINSLLDGKEPACSEGKQIWDYIYAKDAAMAFYLLGDKGKHGKVYCIGSGNGMPLKTYIEEIRDIINPQAQIGFGKIPYNRNSVMYLCADIKELENDTGFRAKYSFYEGVLETIDWVKGVRSR